MSAYTQKETDFVVNTYLEDPNWDTVLHIAAKMKRTPRSVVAKLSKEGVYSKEGYTDKLGRRPVTKLALVSDLEQYLDVNLPGLDKAPKETLRILRDGLYDITVNYEDALASLAEYSENAEISTQMAKVTRTRVVG